IGGKGFSSRAKWPEFEEKKTVKIQLNSKEKLLQSKVQRTIKDVTEFIEKLELNKAIGELMQLANTLQKFEEKESKPFSEGIKSLVLMLNPFAPHLSEELWNKIGGKGFSSRAKWPEFEEKKIDVKAEKQEEFIEMIKKDIMQIKELIGKEKINRIKIFIAPEWKWNLMKKLFGEKQKQGRIEFGFAMKKGIELEKNHSKELKGFLQVAVKKVNEMQEFIELNEINVLKDNINGLKKEFETEIELIKAEESSEKKAGNALPLKPAILIE
ncbi:MAG: class I tRNA ligase family protein, partial [Candidatus Diapherotrites archaeon]